MDTITTISRSVFDLLATCNPDGCGMTAFPDRIDDPESTPWVRITVNQSGIADRSDDGDTREMAVEIECRGNWPGNGGNYFSWVEDALGRSKGLAAKLSNSAVKVLDCNFGSSTSEESADSWTRTYNFSLEANLICNP